MGALFLGGLVGGGGKDDWPAPSAGDPRASMGYGGSPDCVAIRLAVLLLRTAADPSSEGARWGSWNESSD
jgi:hypothetical protein